MLQPLVAGVSLYDKKSEMTEPLPDYTTAI